MYIQPWAKEITEINAPVHLWYGREDNWTPIEMEYALRDHFGAKMQMTEFAVLSHYSTLAAAIPKIFDKYGE